MKKRGGGGGSGGPDSPSFMDSPEANGDTPATIKSEIGIGRLSTSGGGGGGSRPLAPGQVSIPRDQWEGVCRRLKEMEMTISNLRVGMEKADETGHIPISALESTTAAASGAGSGSGSGSRDSQSKNSSSPDREGIHAANALGEGTVHLGSRSVLAYILNNKSGSDQFHALLEGGILPKLGLDNESATYPFVDLWSSDMSSFDTRALCSALPGDRQCKELVGLGISCNMSYR